MARASKSRACAHVLCRVDFAVFTALARESLRRASSPRTTPPRPSMPLRNRRPSSSSSRGGAHAHGWKPASRRRIFSCWRRV